MSQRDTRAALGCLALLTLVAITGCMPGRRLLKMEVYLENQLVLRTMFDAPDDEKPAELWKHTGSEPFSSQAFSPIPAQSDDPLHAKLTGSVQIRILHVDRVMTSASLANLELVRETPGSQKWYLPPAELARARGAVGF